MISIKVSNILKLNGTLVVLGILITQTIFHPRSLKQHDPNYKNLVGSNLFLHKITHGTCTSHGLESIDDHEICALATQSYEIDSYDSDEKYSYLHAACASQVGLDEAFAFFDFLKKRLLHWHNIHPQYECTTNTPCLCSSRYYAKTSSTEAHRRDQNANGDFSVTWTLDLGGQDSLLESDFLRAGFEQSVKDYINNDILCSDDLNKKGAEFFGVEIPNIEDQLTRNAAVSGNGKCRGQPKKCKKPIDLDALEADLFDDDVSKVVKAFHGRDVFCDVFLKSTIFDAFKERILIASSFDYNVDLDVVNDLEGSLNLKYDVGFTPSKGTGLDKMSKVGLDAKEPVEIKPTCVAAQCETQRETIRTIFEYFVLPFDQNKHECLLQGVNCNDNNLVTHIWMVNHGFQNKTIPEIFGTLPSLQGLFLGGNQLRGTIPTQLASIQKLRMLWLENNELTGPIPTNLGNLRGLRELNLYQNKLTGTIPVELAKLLKIKMLNLSRNRLRGQMPNWKEPTPEEAEDCVFGGVFKKLNPSWLTKKAVPPKIKTLSISENQLSGTIPPELALMSSLEELSLASNRLTGDIPSQFGDLRFLKSLDLHENFLFGTIPFEIGKLHLLERLNLYNNNIEKTIPKDLWKLVKLKELLLDDNRLTGSLATDVGNLTKLETFTFSGNAMMGTLPSELGNLVELTNFDLRGYKVVIKKGNKKAAGTIPTELGNLKKWKHAVFDDNGVEGAVPTEFGNLQSSETLWLKNQGVSGGMPSELANMGKLSQVSFGGSNLGGTIPTELGVLDMATLDLGGNGFTGGIPSVLANTTKLKNINLDNNNYTGEIPTEFANLPNLTSFSLANNSLSGGIPSEFGASSGLQVLRMGMNKNMTGKIPTELGNLTALENLYLGNMTLEGGIPSELGRSKKLKLFNMTGNNITGKIPSEMGECESLNDIDIGGNQLSGNIPSEFGKVQGLKRAKFGSNKLKGNLPKEFSSISGIKLLSFEDNEFSGALPTEFGLLDELEFVHFGANKFTGAIPSEFGNISTLAFLNLGENEFTGGIPDEFGGLENLEFLDIKGNSVTGEAFWMCKLESYIQADFETINCSHWCGTTSEECNGMDIRDASCADVGCSGAGKPTCTDACRLDYSSCTASSDEITFQFDLQTDYHGSDISWVILDDLALAMDDYYDDYYDDGYYDDDFGTILQSEKSYWNTLAYTEFHCLQMGCYVFELYDEFGDGLCCEHGEGSYSVLSQGDARPFINPRFEDMKRHPIGACTEAPIPSTQTRFPSARPSPRPSFSPSSIPSQIPSSPPSSLPSDNPSQAPSSLPSSIPSLAPSVSSLPSSIPSLAPSVSSLPSSNPSPQPSPALTTSPSIAFTPSPSMSVSSLSPQPSPAWTTFPSDPPV